jgi:hypothetical protein
MRPAAFLILTLVGGPGAGSAAGPGAGSAAGPGAGPVGLSGEGSLSGESLRIGLHRSK